MSSPAHSDPNVRSSTRPFQDGRTRPLKASQSMQQLNVEGLTTAKLDVLKQVANKNKATVVLLQETHKENDAILKPSPAGFTLAGHTKSKHHGLATFIKEDVSWSPAGQCRDDAEVEWKVQETTVVNVYKPPPSRLEQGSLPDSPAPAVYTPATSIAGTPTGGTRAPPKMATPDTLVFDDNLMFHNYVSRSPPREFLRDGNLT